MLLEFIPVIYKFVWHAQQLGLQNGLEPKHNCKFYKKFSQMTFYLRLAICTSLRHGSSSLFEGDIWHPQTVGLTPGVDHHYRYYYNILSLDFYII
jgi:hypothetical protein